jgi:hypothetical protein
MTTVTFSDYQVEIPNINVNNGIAITADNSRIIIGSSQYIYFSNYVSSVWSPLITISGFMYGSLTLSVSSNGNYLCVASQNNNGCYLLYWNGITYINMLKIFENSISNNISAVDISYDGSLLGIISSYNSIYYSYFDLSNNTFTTPIQTLETSVNRVYSGISVSHDNLSLVYSGYITPNSRTNVFYSIWNGTNFDQSIHTFINGPTYARTAKISPNKNVLFFFDGGDHYSGYYIQQYNNTLSGVFPITTNALPSSIDMISSALSSNGNYLYYINNSIRSICRTTLTYIDISGVDIISVNNTGPYSTGCFHENTKILCLINNKEEFIEIKNLKKGVFVKTYNNGYIKIELIGSNKFYNSINNDIANQLYILSKDDHLNLIEDLIITGTHGVLVPELTSEEVINTIKIINKIYITDNLYRLYPCVNSLFKPYDEGYYNVWHIVLENKNIYTNYGINANGLLVETCSKFYYVRYSNLK